MADDQQQDEQQQDLPEARKVLPRTVDKYKRFRLEWQIRFSTSQFMGISYNKEYRVHVAQTLKAVFERRLWEETSLTLPGVVYFEFIPIAYKSIKPSLSEIRLDRAFVKIFKYTNKDETHYQFLSAAAQYPQTFRTHGLMKNESGVQYVSSEPSKEVFSIPWTNRYTIWYIGDERRDVGKMCII